MNGARAHGPRPVRPLTVPTALFERLARGGGGASGMRMLADAEYSRRLTMLWAVREGAARHGGGVERRARAAWQVLAAAQDRAPDTVRALIAYPSAGPALLWTLNALSAAPGPPSGRDPLRGLSCLAAAAVVATGVPARVELPGCGRRVVLPGVGVLRPADPCGRGPVVAGADEGGGYVRVAGRHVAVAAGTPDPAGEWQPLRVLVPDGGPGGGLVLDDIDPFHTGIRDRSGRLPDAEWRHWRRTVAAGRRVLEAGHPGVAAEAAVVLRALIPVGGPAGSRRSSSSKEAFGAAALTLPATPEAVALTLTHELQHNKLAALLHLFDLMDEHPGELFYAPWREDPRPLVGLLHGTYAHLGVARYWHRRLARPSGDDRHEAEVQFARWRSGACEAAGTLAASGRLTRAGEVFVDGMRETLEELSRVRVSPSAAGESAARAAAHRNRWTRRHGATIPARQRG